MSDFSITINDNGLSAQLILASNDSIPSKEDILKLERTLSKLENLNEVSCWGTGEAKREFLHVEDLANATIFALENISFENKQLYDEKSNYLGYLNIGTGSDISIKELATKIAKEFNFKGEIIWDTSKQIGRAHV